MLAHYIYIHRKQISHYLRSVVIKREACRNLDACTVSACICLICSYDPSKQIASNWFFWSHGQRSRPWRMVWDNHFQDTTCAFLAPFQTCKEVLSVMRSFFFRILCYIMFVLYCIILEHRNLLSSWYCKCDEIWTLCLYISICKYVYMLYVCSFSRLWYQDLRLVWDVLFREEIKAWLADNANHPRN